MGDAGGISTGSNRYQQPPDKHPPDNQQTDNHTAPGSPGGGDASAAGQWQQKQQERPTGGLATVEVLEAEPAPRVVKDRVPYERWLDLELKKLPQKDATEVRRAIALIHAYEGTFGAIDKWLDNAGNEKLKTVYYRYVNPINTPGVDLVSTDPIKNWLYDGHLSPRAIVAALQGRSSLGEALKTDDDKRHLFDLALDNFSLVEFDGIGELADLVRDNPWLGPDAKRLVGERLLRRAIDPGDAPANRKAQARAYVLDFVRAMGNDPRGMAELLTTVLKPKDGVALAAALGKESLNDIRLPQQRTGASLPDPRLNNPRLRSEARHQILTSLNLLAKTPAAREPVITAIVYGFADEISSEDLLQLTSQLAHSFAVALATQWDHDNPPVERLERLLGSKDGADLLCSGSSRWKVAAREAVRINGNITAAMLERSANIDPRKNPEVVASIASWLVSAAHGGKIGVATPDEYDGTKLVAGAMQTDAGRSLLFDSTPDDGAWVLTRMLDGQLRVSDFRDSKDGWQIPGIAEPFARKELAGVLHGEIRVPLNDIAKRNIIGLQRGIPPRVGVKVDPKDIEALQGGKMPAFFSDVDFFPGDTTVDKIAEKFDGNTTIGFGVEQVMVFNDGWARVPLFYSRKPDGERFYVDDEASAYKGGFANVKDRYGKDVVEFRDGFENFLRKTDLEGTIYYRNGNGDSVSHRVAPITGNTPKRVAHTTADALVTAAVIASMVGTDGAATPVLGYLGLLGMLYQGAEGIIDISRFADLDHNINPFTNPDAEMARLWLGTGASLAGPAGHVLSAAERFRKIVQAGVKFVTLAALAESAAEMLRDPHATAADLLQLGFFTALNLGHGPNPKAGEPARVPAAAPAEPTVANGGAKAIGSAPRVTPNPYGTTNIKPGRPITPIRPDEPPPSGKGFDPFASGKPVANENAPPREVRMTAGGELPYDPNRTTATAGKDGGKPPKAPTPPSTKGPSTSPGGGSTGPRVPAEPDGGVSGKTRSGSEPPKGSTLTPTAEPSTSPAGGSSSSRVAAGSDGVVAGKIKENNAKIAELEKQLKDPKHEGEKGKIGQQLAQARDEHGKLLNEEKQLGKRLNDIKNRMGIAAQDMERSAGNNRAQPIEKITTRITELLGELEGLEKERAEVQNSLDGNKQNTATAGENGGAPPKAPTSRPAEPALPVDANANYEAKKRALVGATEALARGINHDVTIDQRKVLRAAVAHAVDEVAGANFEAKARALQAAQDEWSRASDELAATPAQPEAVHDAAVARRNARRVAAEKAWEAEREAWTAMNARVQERARHEPPRRSISPSQGPHPSAPIWEFEAARRNATAAKVAELAELRQNAEKAVKEATASSDSAAAKAASDAIQAYEKAVRPGGPSQFQHEQKIVELRKELDAAKKPPPAAGSTGGVGAGHGVAAVDGNVTDLEAARSRRDAAAKALIEASANPTADQNLSTLKGALDAAQLRFELAKIAVSESIVRGDVAKLDEAEVTAPAAQNRSKLADLTDQLHRLEQERARIEKILDAEKQDTATANATGRDRNAPTLPAAPGSEVPGAPIADLAARRAAELDQLWQKAEKAVATIEQLASPLDHSHVLSAYEAIEQYKKAVKPGDPGAKGRQEAIAALEKKYDAAIEKDVSSSTVSRGDVEAGSHSGPPVSDLDLQRLKARAEVAVRAAKRANRPLSPDELAALSNYGAAADADNPIAKRHKEFARKMIGESKSLGFDKRAPAKAGELRTLRDAAEQALTAAKTAAKPGNKAPRVGDLALLMEAVSNYEQAVDAGGTAAKEHVDSLKKLKAELKNLQNAAVARFSTTTGDSKGTSGVRNRQAAPTLQQLQDAAEKALAAAETAEGPVKLEDGDPVFAFQEAAREKGSKATGVQRKCADDLAEKYVKVENNNLQRHAERTAQNSFELWDLKKKADAALKAAQDTKPMPKGAELTELLKPVHAYANAVDADGAAVSKSDKKAAAAMMTAVESLERAEDLADLSAATGLSPEKLEGLYKSAGARIEPGQPTETPAATPDAVKPERANRPTAAAAGTAPKPSESPRPASDANPLDRAIEDARGEYSKAMQAWAGQPDANGELGRIKDAAKTKLDAAYKEKTDAIRGGVVPSRWNSLRQAGDPAVAPPKPKRATGPAAAADTDVSRPVHANGPTAPAAGTAPTPDRSASQMTVAEARAKVLAAAGDANAAKEALIKARSESRGTNEIEVLDRKLLEANNALRKAQANEASQQGRALLNAAARLRGAQQEFKSAKAAVDNFPEGDKTPEHADAVANLREATSKLAAAVEKERLVTGQHPPGAPGNATPVAPPAADTAPKPPPTTPSESPRPASTPQELRALDKAKADARKQVGEAAAALTDALPKGDAEKIKALKDRVDAALENYAKAVARRPNTPPARSPSHLDAARELTSVKAMRKRLQQTFIEAKHKYENLKSDPAADPRELQKAKRAWQQAQAMLDAAKQLDKMTWIDSPAPPRPPGVPNENTPVAPVSSRGVKKPPPAKPIVYLGMVGEQTRLGQELGALIAKQNQILSSFEGLNAKALEHVKSLDTEISAARKALVDTMERRQALDAEARSLSAKADAKREQLRTYWAQEWDESLPEASRADARQRVAAVEEELYRIRDRLFAIRKIIYGVAP